MTMVVGSTEPMEVHVLDDKGNPESPSGWTAATLRIEDEAGESVLLRRTADGNLSIDSARSVLVATILQAESDALVPGFYVGDFAILRSGLWVHGAAFYVRIQRGRSPHSS